MFIVTARWLAKMGQDDQVADLLKRAVVNTRAEPGCMLFMANRSVENPRRFLVYEQFEDEAAFAAHVGSAPFKEVVLEGIVPRLELRERETYSLLEP